MDWLNLGVGTRISGGWQLAGVSVASNVNLRGRGYLTGGSRSSWLLETIIGPLVLVSQPLSCTINAGTMATFSVVAGGTEPFGYQWRKGAVNLSDGGNVSGATTPILTLSNVFGADAGAYSVVITNVYGSLTSAVATLTVVDPVITYQPASQFTNSGQSVILSVTAVGTAPLTYQWRQDGVPRAGATASSLTLTNLQGADAGGYDLVVANQFGSATSAVALLTVNLASVDTSFNPNPDGEVFALAVQADGKIVMGGRFGSLGGQTRYSLGRLYANGTLDSSFNPGAWL